MNTKYVVLLGDGMADYPIPELDNKTPLQAACKPNMDSLAAKSLVGLVKTVPEGLPPASDVANLSVFGYDPKKHYTGRSPIEAISMGVNLADDEVAFRCNLVTLTENEPYESKIITDHSSDEITTGEAVELIKAVKSHFETKDLRFYTGISYRHCMVWKKENPDLRLTPPHDILGKKITDFLPSGKDARIIRKMMEESFNFLNSHNINTERRKRGLKPANSIWLWGQGKKPSLPLFSEKFKKTGSVISAVDLIKGIGICAGLTAVDVPGATGNIHTNFEGKAEAALKELQSGKDFVYIHVEAPDECGHRFEMENKIKSIELIDKLVLGTLLKGLEKFDSYKIMILPDHPTPLSLRTHTADPVPFIIYDNLVAAESGVSSFNETEVREKGIFIENGHELMEIFLAAK
ncbi:MAG TPA: cofactor-independent phosphoglycerate mutase [Clostridiaceae bacterium]|nr:cofactor-independent phosphoglycerate mutase [Clostridiaceae bacterium]